MLKINFSSRFTLNIIDNLIIVHNRSSYSSLIFDIKLAGEFDGYTTCNQPIIRNASIKQARTPLAHAPSLVVGDDDGLDHSQGPGMSQRGSSAAPSTEMYSINWIMFLPNAIIDAKLGNII